MEAIILAGGFGTRLRPLTYTRAKSLLPILNKPMIVHLMDTLPDEVNKVILAVNYKNNQIEKYFKDNDYGKEVIVNNELKPLGTGGAVKFAEKHISERFLVLNSDIICSLDISEMIKFHIDNKSMSTISLWPVENVSEFGVVDIKKNGNIVNFVEKPNAEDAPSEFINAGAYCLEPDILDYIETDRLVSMEKEIFPQVIKESGRFFGFKFSGFWMDIGRISSYIEVNKYLMKKKKFEYFHGDNCKIFGKLKETCIGNNVYIGKNSKVNSSIIYDNTVVEDNVNINNCVIGENCKVGSFTDLKNTVLGDNEILKDGFTFDNEIIWSQPIPKGYPDKQIGNVIEK